MSTVCSWFTFLCMRENNSQKPRKVHPNQSKYDAMVVWKGKADKPIKKSGSLAFEVILKPASNNSPLRPVSPPKSSRISLSEEDIKLKLQKAEERRQSLEAQRLEQLAKEREKAQEVLAKAAQESLQFSKATQEKLRRSMEANKENREAQIKALQERLREHANHIQEVCQASENMGKVCEEKLVSKMENALRNREEQLKALQERLLEHERRIEEVQKKKGMKQEENEMGDA
ncbi:stathmin-like isoform X3 [Littorina saxatilis]|uniref:Stathmin n=1 Tax=Littorina saxatilis TaxID=31220 RepID=A0AAN9B7K4_9CAEN